MNLEGGNDLDLKQVVGWSINKAGGGERKGAFPSVNLLVS